MTKYTRNGVAYDSYQDYCNSRDLDPDLIYLYLYTGDREPQNEREIKWKEEADRLTQNGQSFELPFN